jgi:hypothetical protein
MSTRKAQTRFSVEIGIIVQGALAFLVATSLAGAVTYAFDIHDASEKIHPGIQLALKILHTLLVLLIVCMVVVAWSRIGQPLLPEAGIIP